MEDMSTLLTWKLYLGGFVENSRAFSECVENTIMNMIK